MKRLSFIAVLPFLLSFTLITAIIPDNVIKAFEQKYPNIHKVKWQQEQNNNFEADFIFNGSEVTAYFDKDGKWLMTETTMDVEMLPASLSKKLRSKFPNAEVTDVMKIEKSDNVILFEIGLEKAGHEFEVKLDNDGNEVK